MSWVESAAGSRFPIEALPYGSVSTADGRRVLGVAIGDQILDLQLAAEAGLLDVVPDPVAVFGSPILNPLLSLDDRAWAAARDRIRDLLTDHGNRAAVDPLLMPREGAELHLPVEVADYVDFFASREHAEFFGRALRPGESPLAPNWLHVPLGYHGRTGTFLVSGTAVRRPMVQRQLDDGTVEYGASNAVDIELEFGFLLGNPTTHGSPTAADDAGKHIFGVSLMNDWTSRDMQRWEMEPLGPFLSKSFATTIAGWILPMQALESVRVPGPVQDPEPLPYLRTTGDWGLDIAVEVWVRPAGQAEAVRVSATNARRLYWTGAQQLAHMTMNGSPVRAGDFFASGTMSGDGPAEAGSLTEVTNFGTDPITIGADVRGYLEDGDEVILRGHAQVGDATVHLGDVAGTVLPAIG